MFKVWESSENKRFINRNQKLFRDDITIVFKKGIYNGKNY